MVAARGAARAAHAARDALRTSRTSRASSRRSRSGSRRRTRPACRVLVDASQSVAHLPIDVRALDVDFLGFSSHKMFGPNGVGVLYVRRDRFAELELGNVGGGMVALLADDRFEPLEAPFRYEAGTPNVEGVIGLGAAVDYLLRIGMPQHRGALARARRRS